MSTISIWMAIARKHKNLLNVTQNTIIITITVSLCLARSRSIHNKPSAGYYFIYFFHFFFFIIVIPNGKQNHEIIVLKVQIAWMHPTHMILLRVLKINNVTKKNTTTKGVGGRHEVDKSPSNSMGISMTIFGDKRRVKKRLELDTKKSIVENNFDNIESIFS